MAQRLWNAGLRMVNDVVYNPTTPSGLGAKVTLDMVGLDTTVGMAGNLRLLAVIDRSGRVYNGGATSYDGAQTGYALDPHEAINDVEAHDNCELRQAP